MQAGEGRADNWAAIIAAASLLGLADGAIAQRIDNGIAVFATLDKVTARISRLEVPLNQTAQFGSLKVTPRACYSRPPTEPPKTTGFVVVEETMLDGQQRRLFSGWMFAESPGLNAVEHPVFDVWLTECNAPLRPAAAAAPPGTAAAAATKGAAGKGAGPKGPQQQPTQEPLDEPLPQRRVRR